VPYPSRKGRRRRCVLCGLAELTSTSEFGRFLLVADPRGRGPICPAHRGCEDRQRQLDLLSWEAPLPAR
jgi:hypothetical protein